MERLTLFDAQNIKPNIQIEKKIKSEIELLLDLRDDKPRIEEKKKDPKTNKMKLTGKLLIPKSRKSSKKLNKKLIVPKITENNFIRNLNNDHWKYSVNGAFIDALGIMYDYDREYETIMTRIDLLTEKEKKMKKHKNRSYKKVRDVRICRKILWEGWIQTPFLDFKEGDSLDSKCGTISLQIEDAHPIQWDFENEKIIEGFVRYKIYKVENGLYEVIDINSCTQMEFLEKLIYGKYEGE